MDLASRTSRPFLKGRADTICRKAKNGRRGGSGDGGGEGEDDPSQFTKALKGDILSSFDNSILSKGFDRAIR